MPSTSKKKTAKSATGPGSMKQSWKVSPISTPQEYINSVAISQDGGTVVAGTFYFPYAAGAKHSPADTTQITVGTFAWNAKGKSLWQDKFQATEGVYWVVFTRRKMGSRRRPHCPGTRVYLYLWCRVGDAGFNLQHQGESEHGGVFE
jgi:hypothetical protein